ncbi:hypothetical protein JCM16303_004680 [Sporobolomyces ruberrimus]
MDDLLKMSDPSNGTPLQSGGAAEQDENENPEQPVANATSTPKKSTEELWQDWLAAKEERIKAFQEEEDREENEFCSKIKGLDLSTPLQESSKPIDAIDTPLEEIQRALQDLHTQNENLSRELEFARSVSKPSPAPGLEPKKLDDDLPGWASLRIGVQLDDKIDKLYTPLVFYHIRSLFSGEKQAGKTAPLTWFDLHERESGFRSAREVFNSMRSYWADDFSSERSLAKYRSLKQGSMRARDLASELSSLANAAHAFSISIEDRKATFIAALNTQVRDYVRSNLTILKMASGREPSFDEVVQLAARTDDLEGFKRSGPSSSSLPKASSGSTPSGATRSVPERTASAWKDRASSWQEKNPICGEMSTHYSSGCMNSRKNPATVVVASFRPSSTYAHVASSAPIVPDSTPLISFELTVASSLGVGSESGKVFGQILRFFLFPFVGSPSWLVEWKYQFCFSSDEPVPIPSAISQDDAPEIASRPLTVPVRFSSEVAGSALIDSGSQADIVSPLVVDRLGLEVRRLVAPVHADLAADGNAVRLSVFVVANLSVGEVIRENRSFFVLPLPDGVDAILGVPWMRDTGMAVSSTALFVAPAGPSDTVYDFEAGRFCEQPELNLRQLGFTDRPMDENDLSRFVVCALHAGVSVDEVLASVEHVSLEPHNPLLDHLDNDDPSTDLTAPEAEEAVKDLLSRFADVFADELPGPPPFRPVNHEINLVDDESKIRPFAIRIPDRYKAQWTAHLRKFVESGFWSPAALDSACSMFSVPKHDKSQARFVINLKPRNENTVRVASPLPDMKNVRSRFASHRFRSKLDFKAAYEQVRLTPESVPLSGFITPNGTFVSYGMQQSDANAPATMHKVCYLMFSKMLGRFLDAFYDDVLVYSNTRRAHLRHLEIVFGTLRHYKFYLARSKAELFASCLEALGAIVDDEGIHVVPEKWEMIQRWPTPRSPKDILRFMGTVQWMGDHLEQLSEVAAPLHHLTGKVQWNWSPACQLSFDTLKSLVPQTLRPLDLSKLSSGEERLYLFTDASMLGCGGWLGQGPDRHHARPFRFFSSKFNSAQRNYTTTDQELLGVSSDARRCTNTWLDGHEPDPAFDDDFPFPSEVQASPQMVLVSLLSSLDSVPLWTSNRARVRSLHLSALMGQGTETALTSFSNDFLTELRLALSTDPVGSKVLDDPESFPAFQVRDGLLFVEGDDEWRLVIPKGKTTRTDGRPTTFVELVLEYAHRLAGHLGFDKTLAIARRSFW